MSVQAGEFRRLFELATGVVPYEWQEALALRDHPASAIVAPTGAGKTEAVLLDWLWRRRFQPYVAGRAHTPRRLVLALPMRALVEQTQSRVTNCLKRLDAAGELHEPVHVHGLMGGAADDSWTFHPVADAVLVGTIDMLLSRALNRGYGRGRASWPVDFGLLNNDCRWIFDEVQLMDAAVATSAQLAGFRALFPSAAPCETVWMSATLDLSWLETRDHPGICPSSVASVGEDDRRPGTALGNRLHAEKILLRHEIKPSDANEVAKLTLREHHLTDGRLTLVILNQVAVASAVFDVLRRDAPDVVLLHSRYRPPDREQTVARLSEPLGAQGRIVVSTQVIEAGIDLDAAALLTDLAPWASVVQRAGRLNRTGAQGATRLVWLDPGESMARVATASRPYDDDDLVSARAALLELEGTSFSPQAIDDYVARNSPTGLLGVRRVSVLLRKPDLLDLFDTDPTLDGDEPDIGRFIRLGDDLDVGVAWRELGQAGPEDEDPLPSRDEVCAVPVGQVKSALRALEPWRWSYARRRWERIQNDSDLIPGDLLLARASKGGYDPEHGWTGQNGAPVAPIDIPATADAAESDAGDTLSTRPDGRWVTLEEHTRHVVRALDESIERLQLPESHVEALRLAALVHDAGKAHPSFQERLSSWADEKPPAPGLLWAKSPERRRVRVTIFRHELVSALLLLEHHARSRDVDLAAYLVAAHHGKLRLTPRIVADDTEGDWACCLGVRQGDDVPAVSLDGILLGPLRVDLSILALGSLTETTWTERVLDLLDELGPFRLAYLEALLCSADRRASRNEVLT